ncbi:DNA helicase [Carnobacterium maltaromaticum]|uniref:UvrD-helicase domain-containing protein n=1 Tax=Carnobacterium maltaromaticum TaxID=2751 RepID=UPI00191BB35C|nr:UvrD-helicase domain-containing protein [Carnobacterium maltaromaticum]CAD5902071.1 DNA helicase [Carnobacterium maltaromaticum]
MVEKSIEPEVEGAFQCILKKQNFILTGGAGSGKTYSLVSLIEKISEEYPKSKITCITYTNNAVAEIRSRISNDNLWVSTIHEFIWHTISNFQKEIRNCMVELINDSSDDTNIFKKPKDFEEDTIFEIDYFKERSILYDEYYSLKPDKECKISHDHILILAEVMFKKYTKLSDILKDSSNFIFVDEYQDTSPLIKEILLTHASNNSKKNCIVGFFGDSMQAIYDNGIGNIENDSIVRIDKTQNRRNPKVVIDLANKLRNDGIEQEPSEDNTAPNMALGHVIEGDIKFIHAESIDVLENIRGKELFLGWDFDDGECTKELWLTHRFNSTKAGFSELFELYNSDLIFEMIKKIKIKIANGDIIADNKIFEEIVEEAKIAKGRGVLILDLITSDSVYNDYYCSLKPLYWEDIEKNFIDSDSLLSYKFNGLTGLFEASTKRDKILRKLDTIFELLELYQSKKYNSFLRKSKFKITNYDDKKRLNYDMENLLNTLDKTIGEVIISANHALHLENDSSFDVFINDQGNYLWERIKDLPFKEYVKSIEYQREHLPFATQHSVKGSEYDNILVVLDNGKWNKYDFRTLFGLGSTNEGVKNRSAKLFYVCCTRAKKNLVVFMPTDNPTIIKHAEKLFGKDNIIDGDKLSKE